MSLRPVTRLAAWAAVLLAASWALSHLGTAVAALPGALWWLLTHVFGICPCVLGIQLARAAAWAAAFLLLTLFLPGGSGRAVRGMALRTAARTASSLWRLAAFLARVIYRAAEGPPSTQKTGKGK